MRAIGYELFLHLRDHRAYYLIIVFLLAVGLSCGASTAALISTDASVGWSTVLGGTVVSGQGGVFGRALWREVRFFALLALCGLGFAGIPAAALLVAVRGFIVGFVSGFLVSNLGADGLLVTLATVVPQNLLILPGTLATAACAIRAPVRKQWGRRYWLTVGVSFGGALMGAAIEAFLSVWLPNVV